MLDGSAVGVIARSPVWGSLGVPAAGFAIPDVSVCLILRRLYSSALSLSRYCQAGKFSLLACKSAHAANALLQGDKMAVKGRKKSARERGKTRTLFLLD